MNKEEIEGMINKILNTVEGLFSSGRTIPNLSSIFPVLCDLQPLFEKYSEIDAKSCGRLVIKRYIKLLNFMITVEKNEERKVEYLKQLENAYKLAGRVSLEHFIIYYEWEETDKLLEKRYNILQPYVYYLNKMCFDPTFEGMIVNLPSRVW